MKQFALTRRLGAYSLIIQNAGSIISANLMTVVLGFPYWWLAARLFPPSSVGLASAAISAMMLLSIISVFGLGTFLLGELPRRPEQAKALITTALMVSGTISAILGVAFALAAPLLSPELGILAHSIANVILFAAGVSISTISIVLDQALIGLMRGSVQLWRNMLFSAAKLGFVLGAGYWIADKSGLTIYGTWLLGMLVSFIVLRTLDIPRSSQRHNFQMYLRLFRDLWRTALAHHLFNLSLQVPNLLLPLVVATLLSTTLSASFYVAWMIAGLLFAVSTALTSVLYATCSGKPQLLARNMRFTMGTAIASGLIGNLIFFVGGEWILELFGSSYAEQANWCLRILTIAVFPLTFRMHFLTIYRVQQRLAKLLPFTITAGLLEIVFAIVGALFGGLNGLAIGWLAALCLEAVVASPTLYRIINTAPLPAHSEQLQRIATGSSPSLPYD